MDRVTLVREELHRALHGGAWHGSALMELLEDVSAEQALARQLPNAHSIAELALHCLAWTEEVTRRLSGAAPGEPERGDWPEVPEPLGEEEWSAIREGLRSAGAALDGALDHLPLERLLEHVGAHPHDAPLGSGVTIEAMLHGLAQHHAYHGGQVALLKRGLAGDPSGGRPRTGPG